MSGSSDDGGEDGSWSIVSGESGLAHTGSIVDNEGGYFVFHFCCFCLLLKLAKVLSYDVTVVCE